MVAVLALPLAQLAPLPPAIWSHLHGRQTVVDAYKAAGVGPPWLPISLTPDETWNAVLGLAPPAAMFCAVLTLDTKFRVWCARALVVLALLSVGLEMLQIARGESSALRLYEAPGPAAVVGFFANSNHQASFLASAMPLAAYLCMSSAGRRRRVIPALLITSAITLTFILAIAATRSRAGVLLAMAMTLGVFAVSARTAGIEQVKTPRRRIALALLAALACGVALATMFSFAPLAERIQSDVGDVRPQVFRLVTAAGGSYAPLGSGVGSFETVYRMLESPGSLTWEYINHAHNDFLETWLEAGWPGVFLIAGFLCWWIAASVTIWRGARTPYGGLALAGALLHVFNHALFKSLLFLGAGDVVTATGTRTKFGHTAELVRTAHVTSSEQKAVLRVVRNLAMFNSVVIVMLVAYAYRLAMPLAEIIPLVLTAILASIPVALPATFTVAAALGARALARLGVLPTRLSAVDEAASIDVLCADKTGTLTLNELTVTAVHPAPGFDEASLLGLAAVAGAGFFGLEHVIVDGSVRLAPFYVTVIFGALLSRFPALSLAVPESSLRWRPSSLIHGLETLPVRLT